MLFGACHVRAPGAHLVGGAQRGEGDAVLLRDVPLFVTTGQPLPAKEHIDDKSVDGLSGVGWGEGKGRGGRWV